MEKFIPVVVIKELSETDKIMKALKNNGINCAEITFRTACAAEAIAYASKNYPDMEIGAGTVINAEQCEAALAAGYKEEFLLSTGLTLKRESDGRLYDRFRDRVMFPVHNISGRVVAFGGRTLRTDGKVAK